MGPAASVRPIALSSASWSATKSCRIVVRSLNCMIWALSWGRRVPTKPDGGRARRRQLLVHRGRGVEHEHERDRDVLVVEDRELLPHAVLEDREIVLREVGDVAAAGVGHGDVEVDDLDARAEHRRARGRLRARSRSRAQHGGQDAEKHQLRREAAARPGESWLQPRGMPIRTFAPGRATLTSTLRSLSLRPATLS